MNNEGNLEPGWNKFSIDSVKKFLETKKEVEDLQFIKHNMPFDIPRKKDPMRSWTRMNENEERILWNGLNMEISIYFVTFRIK